jgi:anti-sigma factor RsiW
MKDLDTMLMAYADGELDGEQVLEVEALIAAQPAVRRTIEQHQQATALLRAACAEGFYASGHINLPRPSVRPRLRHYAGWAIAATVAGIIGFGGGTLWKTDFSSPRDRLVAEVAEYHEVFSHETKHLVEIPASQTDELTAWLGNRIGRNINVPDLTRLGLQFAGGRMLVVDGRPIAELMYTRDAGGPIALCIAGSEDAPTSALASIQLDRKGDLTLASWYSGQHTFVVVGEADDTTIRDIARQSLSQIAG